MQYILPAEVIIVALAAVAGFFIKKWMDHFETNWRGQMDSMERRHTARFDKIESKLDMLMFGGSAYVSREEFLKITTQLQSRMDEHDQNIIELASRMGAVEGKSGNHG
jgi:hypothetical protein